LLTVTMKELLEAGVHFGHQTKSWNPKMKDFIFGQRNGIYIIDLQKTIKIFKESLQFIEDLVAEGKEVLIVGTKKQAQDIIKDYAQKCEACYVNQRWLGGLLTNFSVIRGSVERLIELDEMKEDGRWDLLTKKEQSKLDKVYRKLNKNLGGIRNMSDMPGALFVIDSTREEIAIMEAQKLKIPVIAVVDTNGDPENINFPIPGNDDAVRAIELFTMKVADAIQEGKKRRLDQELQEKDEAVAMEEETGAAEEVSGTLEIEKEKTELTEDSEIAQDSEAAPEKERKQEEEATKEAAEAEEAKKSGEKEDTGKEIPDEETSIESPSGGETEEAPKEKEKSD
jgi:small subunit ribosomal protein S2